jgi:2-amino-4-hydroxy-6-hydroxymethyldihydropteridine diphosphokinase
LVTKKLGRFPAPGKRRIALNSVKSMIFIGIGSNLPSRAGPPRATAEAAVEAMARARLGVKRRSRWYESAPVPISDQPWFVNGVVEVETDLPPAALLAVLHRIEAAFGRTRTAANAARTLDLDLLDYHGRTNDGEDGVILPHPRLHERAFVLLPLEELAPGWRHPRTGRPIAALIAALPPDTVARPITNC